MKKIKIGVLYGGSSAEREISIITGRAVIENLDQKKYLVTGIEMTKTGDFIVVKNKKKIKIDFVGRDRKKFDVIFIALHGAPGENGAIQGMFETLGIKYTGSETLASALAMNKVYAGEIYMINGLPHPQFVNFKAEGWKNNRNIIINDINNKVNYPCVIKPVDQGSAVGVNIVKNQADLEKIIDKSIKTFPWLMAQKFIDGVEATCGVIEIDGKIAPLPPTHIIANAGEFYDYKSKYGKGGSTHICPADFSGHTNEHIQNLALQAHIALGCRGMSRTDIFVSKDEKLYIIETNTIPGMTPVSLFPEAAAKINILFPDMLDLIVKASL